MFLKLTTNNDVAAGETVVEDVFLKSICSLNSKLNWSFMEFGCHGNSGEWGGCMANM